MESVHFENGSLSKAAASITVSMISGIRAVSWSRCIEKAERRKFRSAIRTRSLTRAWCAALVKNWDSIRHNCPDRKAGSDDVVLS